MCPWRHCQLLAVRVLRAVLPPYSAPDSPQQQVLFLGNLMARARCWAACALGAAASCWQCAYSRQSCPPYSAPESPQQQELFLENVVLGHLLMDTRCTCWSQVLGSVCPLSSCQLLAQCAFYGRSWPHAHPSEALNTRR